MSGIDDKKVGIVRFKMYDRTTPWFISEHAYAYERKDVLVDNITYAEATAILNIMGENIWRSSRLHTELYSSEQMPENISILLKEHTPSKPDCT